MKLTIELHAVAEQLPDDDTTVLLFNGAWEECTFGWREAGTWYDVSGATFDKEISPDTNFQNWPPTHWSHIPNLEDATQ